MTFCVCPIHDDGGFGVASSIDTIVVEGVNSLVAVGRQVDQRSTPKRTLDVCAKVETSDNAEIVTAAPQGPVEVRVGQLVNFDDETRCEDNFVIDNVVAGPSILL